MIGYIKEHPGHRQLSKETLVRKLGESVGQEGGRLDLGGGRFGPP